MRSTIDPDLYNRLRRARELMDDCYTSQLTLDELSREACISQYHFLRLFRQAFDKTPHQYLTERRIQAAKELLQKKPIPVTDVCFEVGYESLGSFITLFRKHVGYSPKSYRRVFLINQPLAGIPTCFIQMFAGDPCLGRSPLGRELMVKKMSHSTLYVQDQQKALDFYKDKLGFKVVNDVTMEGGFRWVTVQPPDQPDLEIVLMEPKPGFMFDEQAAAAFKTLLDKGLMGAGVFHTDNCQKTYDELKAKGVEFAQPPADRFYGIEAIFKDGCGNWFSLTQPK